MLLGCALLSEARGQVAHQMEKAALDAGGGGITLSFSGRASGAFNAFYDLFPLERSTDLVTWEHVVTLTRTNSHALGLSYSVGTDGSPAAFYRTPTNILVTPLPPSTGPFGIGTFSQLLADPKRTDEITRAPHQFMVTFWYPAQIPAGSIPAPYVDRALVPQLNNWLRFSAVNPAFVSRAVASAPPASDGAPWPVVLYSPSGNSHRRENLFKCEELASHGFVVVAMDHRDSFASVFPEDRVVAGQTINENSLTVASALAIIEDRADDARLVLGELERLNQQNPEWHGRLDLDKVGAFGFSLGGAVAAELCRSDARCKAGFGMDGVFFNPDLLNHPLKKPYLFLRADRADVTFPWGPDDRRPAIEAMERDGYFIQIAGTVHWSYSDVPLLANPSVFQNLYGTPRRPLLAGTRINEITAAYLLAFFTKHLKGANAPLLDGPSGQFPEVLVFLKR
jgi:dienelactone hydrolase